MDVIKQGLKQELQKAKKKKDFFGINSIGEILTAIKSMRGRVYFQEIDPSEILHKPNPEPEPIPSTSSAAELINDWDDKKRELFKENNIKENHIV